jgi:hypothetical protein
MLRGSQHLTPHPWRIVPGGCLEDWDADDDVVLSIRDRIKTGRSISTGEDCYVPLRRTPFIWKLATSLQRQHEDRERAKRIKQWREGEAEWQAAAPKPPEPPKPPSEPLPSRAIDRSGDRVVIVCDWCGDHSPSVARSVQLTARDDMRARCAAINAGWSCGAEDLCPDCASKQPNPLAGERAHDAGDSQSLEFWAPSARATSPPP